MLSFAILSRPSQEYSVLEFIDSQDFGWTEGRGRERSQIISRKVFGLDRAQAGRHLRWSWLCNAILVLILVANGGTSGAETDELYEAEVTLQGQGPESQEQAIRAAFIQVLIKVTGDPDAPIRPELTSVLQAAPQYVQQYDYRRGEDPGAGPQAQGARALWVRFDPAAVNRVLRASGAPVWGKTRPSVLVWLAVEEAGQRRLLGAEDVPQVRAELETLVRQRGMPMFLPVLDLEDHDQIQVGDVWGLLEENIRRASQRYAPTVILVGRASRAGGGEWLVRWTLYGDRGPSHWETVSSDREQAMLAGLTESVDTLTGRIAPSDRDEGAHSLVLQVLGLATYRDYVRLLHYLQTLPSVDQVDPIRVDGSELSVAIQYRGTEQSLQQAIARGRTLQSVPAPMEVMPADPGQGALRISSSSPEPKALSYRLLP
jgi:hypothetical protein